MFRSARIKLTAWYLLIIMIISITFSLAIYRVLAAELNRVERAQRLRIEHGLPGGLRIIIPPDQNDTFRRVFYLDPNIISETKERLRLVLILTNIGILAASAAAGYFLAGRTLRPISQMVDEQNRFITDASHELRTPLTSLKSEIEVNLRDKKLTLPDARSLLQSNLEEVNNLQYLSDNLIKLAQYKRGQDNLIISQISLNSVIKQAVKKVTSIAKNKNIIIDNKVVEVKLDGDNQSLVELLVIFLDNAIKYSPPDTRITLTSKNLSDVVEINITDQGVGIDHHDIPHLFDRFYRADKSRTKTDIAGYGLGLSIAEHIIQKHNGRVWVNSTVGKGTTFTIQLPIHH